MSQLKEEKVLAILNGMLMKLNEKDQVARLSDAREACNNDMMKMMCKVYPIVVDNQLKVLETFEISGNRHNLLIFLQTVKVMSRTNVEINRLQSQIQSLYFPGVSIPHTARGIYHGQM